MNDLDNSLQLLDFCLLQYLLSSDSKAITLQKGATALYISFYAYNKKKLN